MKIKLNGWKWNTTYNKEYVVEYDCFGEQFFIDDCGYLWYLDVERDWASCLIAEIIEE